jgi:hypothetical protein
VSAKTGIALSAAVALVVLARAAAYYAHTDPLALALVGVMAIALVAATFELLQRVGRADSLARELATLPRPATLAAVDGASVDLRPLLYSRITQSPAALAGAPFAGYVVGLLVMLGLLGTFLGLFETLRGAREALTSSGDVEALRASLGAPMQGLTRSFGTSAAGVSASAMLGLAAALARRTEARFAQALSAYAAVALGPLTVQGRQLDALERLARQGEALAALPRAVAALDAAASRLTSLEAAWSAAHAEATARTTSAIEEAVVRTTGPIGEVVARTRGAVEEAVARVARDLEAAVGRAGNAAETALAPLVTRAVEGSVAAAKAHVVDVGKLLEADLAARRKDEASYARARDEALARSAAAEEERGKALAALWTETTRATDAVLASTQAQTEARDLAFTRAVAEVARTATAAVEGARERLAEADARAAAHGAQLGAVVTAIEARGDAAVRTAGEQRAAIEALLAAATARAEALDEKAHQGLGAILAAVERGILAHDARAEALDERARAGLAAIVAEVERGILAHDTRAAALEQSLGSELAGHSERLVNALVARIGEREAQLDAVAGSVREAAAGITGGGAELAAVAEMFAGAVDRHREGATEWLAALGTVEGAIARATEDAAGGALGEQLDRARELFDVQLQFHRELLLQLRGGPVVAEVHHARQDEDAPA